MEVPFTSYIGQEPYVFVCYAHDDSAVVYPEMAWLKEQGLNLWYDEGISVGANWRAAIGDSLLGASHVLFYISARSLASEHCNREIGLALDEGKIIVPVYLEAAELTSDLKVGLNRLQALNRDQTAAYQQRLLQALGQAASSPAPESRVEPPGKRRGTSPLLGVAVVLVLLTGAGWWYWSKTDDPDGSSPSTQTTKPSIAVLPFVNMSPDADQDYFSDGVSEEILSLLARNPAIKVISRSSAFSFKNTNTELPVIAEKLGVDHVLEGSVRRSGSTVRVSVQLIDAGSDGFLWSDTYDRQLDDIFAVQSEIAGHVARALNVALGDHPPTDRPVNAESYLLYSQGRHLLGLGMPEAASRARGLLQQAVELDPTFVRAWTELARAHGQRRGREEDAGRKATEAVERALTLDPGDSVANAWRGWQLVMQEHDFEAGVRFYNKSLALDPTNVDVLRGLVNVLQLIGRLSEALSVGKYVVDRDPLCIICIHNLATAYRDLDQLSESSAQYRRSLALRPDGLNVIANLGVNQILQGDGQAALDWIDRLPEKWPAKATLRAIALQVGDRAQERDSVFAALREQGPDSYAVAMVHAWIGESDAAFAILEPIVSKRPLGLPVPRDSLWRPLHADPRWAELLEKSGLSPERLSKLELEVNLPD